MVNNILKELENVLLAEAKKHTPEGSEAKAIAHQWTHAIAQDTPVYAKAAGVNKKALIKLLKDSGKYTNRKTLSQLLAKDLPIQPSKTKKFLITHNSQPNLAIYSA